MLEASAGAGAEQMSERNILRTKTTRAGDDVTATKKRCTCTLTDPNSKKHGNLNEHQFSLFTVIKLILRWFEKPRHTYVDNYIGNRR